MRTLISAIVALTMLSLVPAFAQNPGGYQQPPKPILDVLNAPLPPAVSLSPTRDRMLLAQSVRYPVIADVSAPMLRLAGRRINPNTNGPHMPPRYIAFTLKNVADKSERKVNVPTDAYLSLPVWSPDGRQFAFTHTTAKSIELWVGDASKATARRIPGVTLNAAYGAPFDWMPDSRTLLCRLIPKGRGHPPATPAAPTGPVVQESSGTTATLRTYQDLLQNPHDEALFDYYAAAQLAFVDTRSGQSSPVGKPALFAEATPSPDGQHLLIVRNRRPYSYLLPAFAFPKEIEVWDRKGSVEHRIASLPLEEGVPPDGVPTGPRDMEWRPTEPATLVWLEALDEGDPRKKVSFRDRILTLKAPFKAQPTLLTQTEQRCVGLLWGENKGIALVQDYDPNRRWSRTFLINADRPETAKRLIWDRSVQDRYNDPGTPLMRTLPNGHAVLWQQGDHLFLTGAGASRTGDHPFLDRFDLNTLRAERLFRSDEQSYETVVTLLTEDGSRFLTRYETLTEPPNYFVRTVESDSKVALTDFADPAPGLRHIKKQLVTYTRADGVPLSFTLYLPPDYQPGQRLPTVVWAYPREFGDASLAGQVSGSPHRFTLLSGISHLFLLLQGYAILDGATMPVVGDRETQNNTFLEQIVSSAQAAIDKAVEMGVTDRNRVGVGGHSYGAFMTANLLAHSDLFRAGVARSGAYNRTLTPFGFQAERRTLWEAPEMYLKVSPFLYANKIKEPLLLIHGEADNNPGTFPMQSERLYQAVKGTGGTVRLVMLPHESHGYIARESVEHTLYEMVNWFDRYLKSSSATAGR